MHGQTTLNIKLNIRPPHQQQAAVILIQSRKFRWDCDWKRTWLEKSNHFVQLTNSNSERNPFIFLVPMTSVLDDGASASVESVRNHILVETTVINLFVPNTFTFM